MAQPIAQPGKRITGSVRVELARVAVARYTAGASIRTIAAEMNRSYGFVHRLLKDDAGTELRGRGGNTGGSSARP